jgi:hypothetical protein
MGSNFLLWGLKQAGSHLYSEPFRQKHNSRHLSAKGLTWALHKLMAQLMHGTQPQVTVVMVDGRVAVWEQVGMAEGVVRVAMGVTRVAPVAKTESCTKFR